MKSKSLIDLAENLLDLTNQEAENIAVLKQVAEIPGLQGGIVEALKEGIQLLADSHEYRTRIAYAARHAAYENDKQTVQVCVNAITENIERSQIIRDKMSQLIASNQVKKWGKR